VHVMMIAADTCTAQWLSDQLCLQDDETSSTPAVLVLDCRSSDAYSASHVAGSLLVVMPSIMLRRLRAGAGSVSAAVSDASSRSLFTARCHTSHLVLVDDCGASRNLTADSVVQVLMSRLKKDGCRVSYLLGASQCYR